MSDITLKNLSIHPEFGIELALAVPYAFYLKKQNLLGNVVTCKGMKPFYFFHEQVIENHTSRTIDNVAAGINDLPNNWIHHNALAITGKDYSELSPPEQINVNGVLDYSQWISPPYTSYYNPAGIRSKKMVVITNKYNIEHGDPPKGYFDIQCLYDMFMYFSGHGYEIIYKRTRNTESHFTYDENEVHSVSMNYKDIVGTLDGETRKITDFELVSELSKEINIKTMDSAVSKYGGINYNCAQLCIMSRATKFITVCGGNAIMSSLFGGDVLVYVHKGKEMRPNYFGENSYFKKLSGANVVPIIDDMTSKEEHDYSGLYDGIRQMIKL